MSQRLWTRDQLLKVLALYCQIPFGKMHARNPDVIDVARLIERTPSAVALKLVNFASLDPELRDRGVGGMGNTSRADRAIWEEFYGKWGELAESTIGIDAINSEPGTDSKQRVVRDQPSGPTEKTRETRIRINQRFFRNAVLAAYDLRCCITGISSGALLRASHIVPWAHDETLRLDPRNGLCLNALHDAAFDRGLITLSHRLEIMVSSHLKDEFPAAIYREMFGVFDGQTIAAPERFSPLEEALEYHRRHIFNS